MSLFRELGQRVNSGRQQLADEVRRRATDVLTSVRIPFTTRPESGGVPDQFGRDVLAPTVATLKGEPTRERLQVEFDRIRANATKLAGEPGDIAQRVRHLHHMYVDSGGNHVFPMVALHGALCAKRYFDSADFACEHILSRFADVGELREFSDKMKATNRQVFIDTYTNYWFTKHFGKFQEAKGFIGTALFPLLVGMHHANAEGRTLDQPAREKLFRTALLTEQEQSVSGMVNAAAADFPYDCLESIAFGADLAFAYFPPGEALRFDDFKRQDERVDAAMKAYSLAEAAGWPEVERSMRDYGVLSADYFR